MGGPIEGNLISQKVIIHKSCDELSLVEQDTIEWGFFYPIYS